MEITGYRGKYFNIFLNSYLNGFELEDCDLDLDLDNDQLEKLWKLGFERCWFYYKDGTTKRFDRKE